MTTSKDRKPRPSSGNGTGDGQPVTPAPDADPIAGLQARIRDSGFRFSIDHDVTSRTFPVRIGEAAVEA